MVNLPLLLSKYVVKLFMDGINTFIRALKHRNSEPNIGSECSVNGDTYFLLISLLFALLNGGIVCIGCQSLIIFLGFFNIIFPFSNSSFSFVFGTGYYTINFSSCCKILLSVFLSLMIVSIGVYLSLTNAAAN